MKLAMEFGNNNNVPREEEEEEEYFPVSPTGQYFNSSVLSISVICVLESEIPIDDSQTIPLINDLFLPINPRFSSIMVIDENGDKQWKKVEVNPKKHIKVPIFPEGQSPSFYNDCFNDYISKVAMDPLPQTRPLWEIHIFKYPTTNAAGNLIFKLHHALGDGFSLMGALLSCLQRADDPSLPLTFPAFKDPKLGNDEKGICKSVPRFLSGIFNTVTDFGWSLMKSSFLQDDRTPIRSGDDGVEFRPVDITTISFSIDRIKQIKVKLEVTINDVICGVIFLGTRLYMEATNKEQRNGNATALVLLNTRNIGGYKSTKEMVHPNTESKWGNQFAFMHVSVPDLTPTTSSSSNPLNFVSKAQQIIFRKRNSSAVFLTGKVLDALRTHQSPEATAKYVHSTLKNSSMTISNVIGPVEKLALANHPIKGIYFMVVGVPQSLTITMVSYMRDLRIAVGTERGLINPDKYKDCIQCAFDMIFDAAVGSGVQEKCL